jgi:hypothetical protein
LAKRLTGQIQSGTQESRKYGCGQVNCASAALITEAENGKLNFEALPGLACDSSLLKTSLSPLMMSQRVAPERNRL